MLFLYMSKTVQCKVAGDTGEHVLDVVVSSGGTLEN